MLWAVIMAGGSGERFWPESRTKKPKQFLSLGGETSLIEMTYDRVKTLIEPANIIIITHTEQSDLLKKLLPVFPPENIISEPQKRDTAPAIATACWYIHQQDKDATVLVLPSDQLIHDIQAFKQDVLSCTRFMDSQPDTIVTFGIHPSFPATGYGYLELSPEGPHETKQDTPVPLNRFVEKPDLAKAQAYVNQGNYLWNAGIFLWKSTYLFSQLAQHCPEITDILSRQLTAGFTTPCSLDPLLAAFYPQFPKISIDYALMEKTPRVHCQKATFDWDDIGSWESLVNHFSADANGNIIIGHAVLEECRDCIVYNLSGQKELLISGIKLEKFLIVQTKDAVLVCPRSENQNIKKLVEHIRAQQGQHFL